MTSQPWRARPAKRIYIPKANGKLRPLGIPTILTAAFRQESRTPLSQAGKHGSRECRTDSDRERLP